MPTEPYNAESIFCRIANGEIPCHKLYEDDLVMAFLDVGPLSFGHCLLIPKGHYPTLDSVPEDVAAAMGKVMPKLAQALMAATGAMAYNVLQNNGELAHQAVHHVHFHFIPKFTDDSKGPGLCFEWNAGQVTTEDGRLLAEAIASHML